MFHARGRQTFCRPGRRPLLKCALTRQANVPVDLLNRSDMTNADPANRGSEIFYQHRSPDSAAFAAMLQRQLMAKIACRGGGRSSGLTR
ncbi:MAG: hypothetical protein ACYC9Q_11440, partial [Bacillota bacterium]